MGFLEQIVAIYTTPEKIETLAQCCFVFPTRRAQLFFRKYLTEELTRQQKVSFLPALTTLDAFAGRFSQSTKATPTEALFILYNTYRDLCARRGVDAETVLDFDRFRFWGEMIISDFDDIDRNIADPHQVLRNVADLKEIEAVDYLTPEQEEVLSHYFRSDAFEHDRTERNAERERFWRHVHGRQDGPSEMRERFLNLWRLLEELYTDFRQALERKGLHYPGMTWRKATEVLKYPREAQLPFKQYIFCGFDLLSASEYYILEHLRDAGMADFYWDLASPALVDKDGHVNPSNRGAVTIDRLRAAFPSKYELPKAPFDRKPHIDVVSVASAVGQVKTAGTTLSVWIDDGSINDPANAVDTAVVLADEGLFVPMLNSIPATFTNVNVTLGLPARFLSPAALVSALTSLQLRSRRSPQGADYFHEDVANVVSQPLVRLIAPEATEKVKDLIHHKRMIRIPATTLVGLDPRLAMIWNRIADENNAKEVVGYFSSVLTAVRDIIASTAIENQEEGTETFSALDLEVLSRQIQMLEEFEWLVETYGITIGERTCLHIIERHLIMQKVVFSGEPLCGLQVMTMEQTQILDFKNLVVLSLNERIYPRRSYRRTFIPNALRRAYGLPTIDDEDARASYRFFRLLGQAQNVLLAYDNRTSGINTGEESRYLRQLERIPYYKDIIKKYSVEVPATTTEGRVIVLHKHKEELDAFREGGNKFLSASALKVYLKCSLRFHLKYVKGWRDDSEIVDYMDDGQYGSVLHAVVENFYNYLRERFGSETEGVTVTADMLRNVDHMHYPGDKMKLLDRIVIRVINKEFNNYDNSRLDEPLDRDLNMIAGAIVYFVKLMLRREIEFTPFTFLKAEAKIPFFWKEMGINFKLIIDRVDRTESGLRFVDYKTGGDGITASSVGALFKSNKDTDAILQLLMYCAAYRAAQQQGEDKCNWLTTPDAAIQPIIYKLRDIINKRIEPITIGTKESKHALTSDLDELDEFMPLFKGMIDEIMDESVPVKQTDTLDNCKYCEFLELCGRHPKEY